MQRDNISSAPRDGPPVSGQPVYVWGRHLGISGTGWDRSNFTEPIVGANMVSPAKQREGVEKTDT